MITLKDMVCRVRPKGVGLAFYMIMVFNINKKFTSEDFRNISGYKGTPQQFANVMSRLRKKYKNIITKKINNITYYYIKEIESPGKL